MQERSIIISPDSGEIIGVEVRWSVTIGKTPVTITRRFHMEPAAAYDLAGQACAIAHARLIKRIYESADKVPARCEPISAQDIGVREIPALSTEEKRKRLEAEKAKLEAALKALQAEAESAK